jgi:flagellar assembly factor FliW
MTASNNCAESAPGWRVINTPHLGEIEWDSGSELFLPAGLPGFENEKRLIPVEIPAHRPLVFLQSVIRAETCFVSLPARTIDPEYELSLSEEDRAALLLEDAAAPKIGDDILCLALLLPAAGTVLVNLNAPIAINLHNSRCVQALSPDGQGRYYRLNEAGAWEKKC